MPTNQDLLLSDMEATESELSSMMLDLGSSLPPAHELSDLRSAIRRIRKQREILKDPDLYIESLDQRALSLLELAKDKSYSASKRESFRTEATMLLELSRQAIIEKGRLPKLKKSSLDEVTKITEDLRTLAKNRAEAVKNLDKIVSGVATFLSFVAKALPLAALAV